MHPNVPTVRVTNWPEPLEVIEADDGYASLASYVSAALDASALERQTNLEAINEDWDSAIDDSNFNQDFLYAGAYNNAMVDLYILDARVPFLGYLDHTRVRLNKFTLDRTTWKAEVKNRASFLERGVTDIWGPRCRVALFSPECGVDPTSFEELNVPVGTVTSGSDFTLTVGTSNPFTLETDYGKDGDIVVTKGTNSGQMRRIRSTIPISSSAVQVLLYRPFASPLTTFDTVTLRPGCNHQPGFGDSTGHCVNRYANGVNFQGEYAIPGADSASEGIPV